MKKKDIILIAKIDYRKNKVFYSILLLKLDIMILMIILLLALEKDKKLSINKMLVAVE